nr:DUF6093 family protein [Arthrobacter jiangjiafuii]
MAAGRVAAESLMTDTCIIDRPGEPTTDPDGVVSPSYTPVYIGRCKVQQTLAQSSSPEAGGAVFTVQGARLDIPVGMGTVATGDRVRMVTAMSNPDLVGNVYRIVEIFEKSWQTAQRVRVEELT